MEQEQRPAGDVEAAVILEQQNVFMHRLLNKNKNLFTSGNFKVAKLNNVQGDPVHFLNLNSFYYGIQPNTYFIKKEYPDTTAYIFPHFDTGLSAISFPTHPHFSDALDILFKRVAKFYQLPAALENPQIKVTIEQHYPTIETEQIYYPDNVKKVITETGTFLNKAFTALGGYLKTGVEKCGDFIDNKIAPGETTHVSEENKARWESLKQGTGNFITVGAQYATNLLNPVIQKTKEYSNQLGNKINQSENKTVKYVKDLTLTSGKAVGEAFDGFVKGGTEVAGELGSQSKKIINKKYGPEVIDVITGKKEEEKDDERKEEEKVEKKRQGEAKIQKEEAKPSKKEDHPSGNSGDNLYPQLQK